MKYFKLPFKLTVSPSQQKLLKALGILILALLIPLLLLAVRQRVEIRKKAVGVPAHLSINPPSETLTVGNSITAEVKLSINELDPGAAIVTSVINFEKENFEAKEIQTTGVFATEILKSSLDEANASGVIKITQGLSPEQRDQPVVGTQTIAKIVLRATAPTDSPLGEDNIFFDETNSKAVDINENWMDVTSDGAKYEVTPDFFDFSGRVLEHVGDEYRGLTGVTVELYENSANWQLRKSTVTSANGNYWFKISLPTDYDDYRIVEIDPPGYISESAYSDNDQATIIDANTIEFLNASPGYHGNNFFYNAPGVPTPTPTGTLAPTPTPTPGITTSVVRARFYDPRMNPVAREVCIARFQCDDYGDTKSRYWGNCRTTADYQETIYYSETYNCYGVRTPVMSDLQGVTPVPESGFVSHPSTRRGHGSFYGWPWWGPEARTITFIVSAVPTPTPTTTPRPTPTPTTTPRPTATPTQRPTPTPTTPPGLTATPTPSPTPTLTPSPTSTPPPGAPLLDFAVKFQGIGAGRSEPVETMSQTVIVKVKESRGKMHQFSGVKLVYDPKTGFYSPKAAIPLVDVPKGDGYTIYIKGPKHLQKRFCADGQTKRCLAGQGAISLVAGENTFDFSGLALEAGDLPNPKAEPQQDGVVNTIDIELLRKHECRKKAEYGFPACTQEDLEIADLDLDGYVYDSDMQLIRNTLSAVYEDEE